MAIIASFPYDCMLYQQEAVGEVISSIHGPELGNFVVALGELGRLEMASFFCFFSMSLKSTSLSFSILNSFI